MNDSTIAFRAKEQLGKFCRKIIDLEPDPEPAVIYQTLPGFEKFLTPTCVERPECGLKTAKPSDAVAERFLTAQALARRFAACRR